MYGWKLCKKYEDLKEDEFSGTSNKPSKNISEVALLLDNQEKSGPIQYKEFDEILIKRKIEKDKGSKYYINDKEVSARDVQTFLQIFLPVLTTISNQSVNRPVSKC